MPENEGRSRRRPSLASPTARPAKNPAAATATSNSKASSFDLLNIPRS